MFSFSHSSLTKNMAVAYTHTHTLSLFVLPLHTKQTPPGSLRGHNELMLFIDWPFKSLL